MWFLVVMVLVLDVLAMIVIILRFVKIVWMAKLAPVLTMVKGILSGGKEK